MDTVYDAGIAMTAWLQQTYPQLESFFLFITNLGQEEFYLAMLPIIYWCINKAMGRKLGFIFLLGFLINAIVKQGFREPRPFWLDDSIALDTREEGYGIPSGHTELATLFYLFLAGWIGKPWAWFFGFTMAALMGISRVYLGAHFVQDTIIGFLIGAILLLLLVVWLRKFNDNFQKRILGQRLLVATLIPISLGIFFIIMRLLIGAPDLTVSWADYIPIAERSSILAAAQGVGVLLGFSIGMILEKSRVRFLVDGPIWQRIVRYLVGIIILVAIWAGLGEVFPRDPLWIGTPLRILRYFLVTFWASYYAPWFFVRVRLASAEPPPGITMKM